MHTLDEMVLKFRDERDKWAAMWPNWKQKPEWQDSDYVKQEVQVLESAYDKLSHLSQEALRVMDQNKG